MTESEYLLIKNHEKVRLAMNLISDVHPNFGVNLPSLKALNSALKEVWRQINDELEGCIDED